MYNEKKYEIKEKILMNRGYVNSYFALTQEALTYTLSDNINFLCLQPGFTYLCYGNPCINACICKYCSNCRR